jgi:hypothetical protein
MKNTLTCREAARLLLEDEEHELPVADRLALQAHVKICFACQRFVSQLNFICAARRAHGGITARRTPTNPPRDRAAEQAVPARA